MMIVSLTSFPGKGFSGLFEPIAASVKLKQMAMVHQAIEDPRAHGVVPQVCPPILHDAIGGDDDAAVEFVALMNQGLQQCAGIVSDGAGEEQIVQHEEIAVDDRRSWASRCAGEFLHGVAMEEVVGLNILDLVALQDRLIGNRLGDVGLPGARFADKQRAFSRAAMKARVWSWKQIWRGNLGLKDQSNSRPESRTPRQENPVALFRYRP